MHFSIKKSVGWVFFGSILFTQSACMRDEKLYATLSESQILNSGNPFDPNSSVSGVDDSDDALIPNYRKIDTAGQIHWVRRCTPERYDQERREAIEAAKRDTTRRTIPIKYSLSTGTLMDAAAFVAHRRAVLRKDSPSESQIYVGGPTATVYSGPNAFHYVVNHDSARSHFINGERCFFDTVQVVGERTGGITPECPTAAAHAQQLIYYGETYADANSPEIRDGGVSPRLFKKIDRYQNGEEPQIVPLYVADIREKTLLALGLSTSILNPSFASSAVRRKEYRIGFKSIFDFKALWTHRDAVTKVLSSNRVLDSGGLIAPPQRTIFSNAWPISAYEAVPQLIDWIVFSGLSATIMSTQYTPIVLDLGETRIRTSSLEWGSFFNLAGLQATTAPQRSVSHLTAWLGGYVKESSPNSVSERAPRRVAEDGFLVLPNSDGSITGPQNLFGDGFQVIENGTAKRYANGFYALAAFAKKNCRSKQVRDRYIGPWDGALYASQLKVWVDANRNAVAEPSEVKSLPETGIGALNTCYVLHAQNQDQFGNSTAHRAAFLQLESGEVAANLSDEIEQRLAYGKGLNGKPAQFRVMIDVFFRTLPQVYLEDIAIENVVFRDGAPVPPAVPAASREDSRIVAIGTR
jgi:hypothetical protein